MSFAGFGEAVILNSSLHALAETAILIGGSGNFRIKDNGSIEEGGADMGFPEAHPAVITVAGTDRFDAHAGFSDTGERVDFAAPAVCKPCFSRMISRREI